MIPKEYHYSDVGAPQLTTEAGSILEIFKACLITGYNNKESAGWKLQYDGWVAKGEQKLAFSVGDETEQELIYWLDDSSNPANLSLWSGLNAAADAPVNQITSLKKTIEKNFIVGYEQPHRWHLYATNKFCWFFGTNRIEDKKDFPRLGLCLGFGAVKDLFGEFLPQVIIYKKDLGESAKQNLISSGGHFFLPNSPFSDNATNWTGCDARCVSSSPALIYPCLCSYSHNNSTLAARLHIPAITSSVFCRINTNDSFEVIEKNGAKIGVHNGAWQGTICFDLGEWDNPRWLQDLIN